jgi:hypothetical protein
MSEPIRKNLKIWIVLYFIAFTAFASLSLLPNTAIPGELNYVALLALFVLPVLIALKYNLPKWVLSIFVIATPLIVMLAVIGPNEAGFYGYDPNIHTREAFRLFQEGWDSIASWLGHWPALPAMVSLTVELFALDMQSVGKYLPLVVAAVPFFLFLGLARVIDDTAAFFVGMGAASARTLLMFQVKFIEEPFAMVLLFYSIAAIFVVADRRKQTILVVIAMVSLTLMHHYIAAVGAVVFFFWGIIAQLSLPWRFRTFSTRYVPLPIYVIVAVVAMTFIFMYPYDSFTGFVFGNLISGIESASPAGGSSGLSGFAQYLISASFVVYFVMSIITAAGVLSKDKIADWELSWAVLSGIFAVGFIGTTIAGKIIPLSAGRFLGILIPLLVSITVTMLVLKRVSIPRERIVAMILVLALIITQLAAVPIYRIDTNPSQMVHPEAHYTSSEYATTDWIKEHGEGQLIVDEQPHLWHANNYRNVTTHAESSDCAGYSVERDNYLGIDQWTRPPDHSVLYSAEGITISQCLQ